MVYLVSFKKIECGHVTLNEHYNYDTKSDALVQMRELFDYYYDGEDEEEALEIFDGDASYFEFFDDNCDTILCELIEV